MATITRTAMAATTHEPIDRRIALRGVSWATYLKLVEDVGDCRVLMAYNRGVLEFMSPGPIHERFKKRLDRLILVLCEELDVPCMSFASTRWQHFAAEKGIEPDDCYLLTAEKVAASGHGSRKSTDYPFPDLVVEIDMRRSQVDRPDIYATMGVPEVWRFDDGTLFVDRLRPDGAYGSAEASGFLTVRAAEVSGWLEDVSGDDNAWSRRLRAWVRAEVAPRRG